MQKINVSKNYSVEVYNNDDYIANNRKINEDCVRILASYEGQNENFNLNEAYDQLANLNSDLFLDDKHAQIYIMYNQDTPTVFAICTKIEKSKSWVLDLMYTHCDYQQLGLATAMIRLTANHLHATQKATELNTVVDKKNLASIYLNQSFGKVKNVKCCVEDAGPICKFHFDISNLNKKEVEEDTNEILF